MRFDEKLIQLRKREGLSQEQLAGRLGVSRQSVSKWESGIALPELAKIITLSEMFHISVDYLVKDSIEAEEINMPKQDETFSQDYEGCEREQELEAKVDEIHSYMKGYEFTSKTKIGGIPLVSIRFSRGIGKTQAAKGIIAIGNIAIGFISIGLVSVGVLSFGCLALGILAMGVVVYGNQVAVGVAAWGRTVVAENRMVCLNYSILTESQKTW